MTNRNGGRQEDEPRRRCECRCFGSLFPSRRSGSLFRFAVSVRWFGSLFRFAVPVRCSGCFRFAVPVRCSGSLFRFAVPVRCSGSLFRFAVPVRCSGSLFRFAVSVRRFGSLFLVRCSGFAVQYAPKLSVSFFRVYIRARLEPRLAGAKVNSIATLILRGGVSPASNGKRQGVHPLYAHRWPRPRARTERNHSRARRGALSRPVPRARCSVSRRRPTRCAQRKVRHPGHHQLAWARQPSPGRSQDGPCVWRDDRRQPWW